jgi:preprotein translocase subunit SecF
MVSMLAFQADDPGSNPGRCIGPCKTKMINKEKFSRNYDKNYKLLALIPVILVVISLVYIGFFWSANGDFIKKDVTLSGGTTITLTHPSTLADLESAESKLSANIPDASFKRLTDIGSSSSIALVIESSLGSDELSALVEKSLGYELTNDNSSVEFSGPSISKSFYAELLRVVLLSFILMGLVVFFIFGESRFLKSLALLLSLATISLTFPFGKSLAAFVIVASIGAFVYCLLKFEKKKSSYVLLGLGLLLSLASIITSYYYLIFAIVIVLMIIYVSNSVPSIAVIFAAFSDLVITVAVIDLLGVKISAPGLVAFLMLIGYSVDTDILLTNKALRGSGSLNSRIYDAFKTGSFMTLTALAAVLPSFLFITGLPDAFRQIFLVVSIGLFADLFNTWLTNAGIVKWYCQKKGIN